VSKREGVCDRQWGPAWPAAPSPAAQLIDTSVGRVFVSRRGAGPPLVLIHGFLMSHRYFAPLFDALAVRHEVVALDLPGFGESDVPRPSRFSYDLPAFAGVVDELLERLGIGDAVVLGHSMGGGVALQLAARHAARVARLVLVSAVAYPVLLPPLGKLLLDPRLGAFLWRHGPRRVDFARRMRRDVKDPRVVTDELVDHTWASFNRQGARVASHAALVAMARLHPAPADPGRVRVPTLLLWGDEDRVVPITFAKRLAGALPGASLRVIPAAGHWPFLERPREFLRQLAPFLGDTELPSEVAR
jgi:pimeloyl-ACP methyl ester carboxylesterase